MKPRLMPKESVEALREYLSTIPGIYVLPADDPLEAINGFVSYHGEKDDDGQGEDESSMYFGYRFAKPVPEGEARMPILPDILDDDELGEQVIAMIRRCVSEDYGFVKCDRPKELWMGFVKYAPLDSNDETEALFIPVHLFKRLPKSVKNQIEEWRKRKSREAGREFYKENIGTAEGREKIARVMTGGSDETA